jgi:heptosyltransferase-3
LNIILGQNPMWETGKIGLARYNLWDDRTALKLLSGLLFPGRRLPEMINHIVVYRVGNIGDTVVAIPALVALRERFPAAKITLITSAGNPDLPGAEDVLSAFPGLVNRVVSYLPAEAKSPLGLTRLKSEITAENSTIDLWISLPVTLQTVCRGFREILLARWLGSRYAIGFTLLLPEFFRTEYARANPLPRTSDWLLSIVQSGTDIPLGEPDCLAHFQSPAPDLPKRLGIVSNRPLLVVNAGAKLAIKRWPSAAFHQAFHLLLEKIPDLQVVLLGNQAERHLNDDIAQNLKGTVLNAAGQLTLGETWSLLHAATAVLTNDTGAMHMAGLLGKTVVTPMSGQYPAPLWHPPGPDIEVLSHPVPCAPCFKDNCPLPSQICLDELSPEQVVEALLPPLKQRSG